MQCPSCRIPLHKIKNEHGVLWNCGKCKGCAVGIGLLQNFSDQKLIREMWAQIQQKNQVGKKKCPDCVRMMFVVIGGPKTENLELDVCSNCQFFWFDANEMGKLPRLSNEEIERRNTEHALRTNSANLEIEKMEELIQFTKSKTSRKEKVTQEVMNDAVATLAISAIAMMFGSKD